MLPEKGTQYDKQVKGYKERDVVTMREIQQQVIWNLLKTVGSYVLLLLSEHYFEADNLEFNILPV